MCAPNVVDNTDSNLSSIVAIPDINQLERRDSSPDFSSESSYTPDNDDDIQSPPDESGSEPENSPRDSRALSRTNRSSRAEESEDRDDDVPSITSEVTNSPIRHDQDHPQIDGHNQEHSQDNGEHQEHPRADEDHQDLRHGSGYQHDHPRDNGPQHDYHQPETRPEDNNDGPNVHRTDSAANPEFKDDYDYDEYDDNDDNNDHYGYYDHYDVPPQYEDLVDDFDDRQLRFGELPFGHKKEFRNKTRKQTRDLERLFQKQDTTRTREAKTRSREKKYHVREKQETIMACTYGLGEHN